MEYEYETPEYNTWHEKADKAKEEVLNQAMMRIEDLYAIINRKLGFNLTWTQQIKDGRSGKYIDCESSDIPLDSIGVCKYLFREINLATFNSSVYIPKTYNRETHWDEYEMEKDPVAKVWMTINFSYEHTGGGSNGHDFCSCWFEDGKWKVQFVEEEEVITSSKQTLKSAMPGREKYIQAIMDEYGCSHEEAEEIIADEINSGCHGKSKKKEEKKDKIEQTRRARNTESLNNLYGKMY